MLLFLIAAYLLLSGFLMWLLLFPSGRTLTARFFNSRLYALREHWTRCNEKGGAVLAGTGLRMRKSVTSCVVYLRDHYLIAAGKPLEGNLMLSPVQCN